MLRLLPSLYANKLSVFISAESIAVISNAGTFSNNNTNKSSMTFTQQTNQPAWQHAINQLDNLLGDFLVAQQMKPKAQQVKPKTSLQIVLGSDLVRYVALPAQAIMMNLAEKKCLCKRCF